MQKEAWLIKQRKCSLIIISNTRRDVPSIGHHFICLCRQENVAQAHHISLQEPNELAISSSNYRYDFYLIHTTCVFFKTVIVFHMISHQLTPSGLIHKNTYNIPAQRCMFRLNPLICR